MNLISFRTTISTYILIFSLVECVGQGAIIVKACFPSGIKPVNVCALLVTWHTSCLFCFSRHLPPFAHSSLNHRLLKTYKILFSWTTKSKFTSFGLHGSLSGIMEMLQRIVIAITFQLQLAQICLFVISSGFSWPILIYQSECFLC